MINEKAHELGRLLGQSEEHKVLERARKRVAETPELKAQLDRLQIVAEAVERAALSGEEPPPENTEEYDTLMSRIQTDSRYQQLVAAQANFEKMMFRVNEQMAEGIRKGAESPIITLS